MNSPPTPPYQALSLIFKSIPHNRELPVMIYRDHNIKKWLTGDDVIVSGVGVVFIDRNTEQLKINLA